MNRPVQQLPFTRSGQRQWQPGNAWEQLCFEVKNGLTREIPFSIRAEYC